MMLRLQSERMQGAFIPSAREYHHLYGLTRARLARAAPGALVMHPGPMNRGVEIDSEIADLIDRSVITRQVEMGVRSEEHTSELQSLMRISYAVFCLKKKKNIREHT